MRDTVSDPAWKSGPVRDAPTSSDHAIAPEDFGASGGDFDGFGRSEVEQVDGVPLIAIQEQAVCSREHCDAAHKRRLLFTTDTLTEPGERRLRGLAYDYSDDALAEYVAANAERVDVETIEVDDIRISAETIVDDPPSGSCYGDEQPSPDVHAHMYDL